MAVGVGFEPTVTCATTVFKTAAFVHSAIPPLLIKEAILILTHYYSFVKRICTNTQKHSIVTNVTKHLVGGVSNPNFHAGHLKSGLETPPTTTKLDN